MTGAFDAGGAAGYGSIDVTPDEHPFHHEWEARVFALNRVFLKRGFYTLDEFRNAVERMDPEQYRAASYYERWFAAIEMLLHEKNVLA